MSHRNRTVNEGISPPSSLPRSVSTNASFTHKRSCSLGGVSLDSPTACDRWSHGGSSTLLSNKSSSGFSLNGGVLGQNFSGNNTGSRKSSKSKNSWKFASKSKASRNPEPAVTFAIFEAVGRGLRECINVAEDDISNLKSNIESLSVSSSQQLKAAERFLKRVEFQLTKIDELYDQYELQQKLRDGVRSMAYAFVMSPGKERESALNNVRCGYKECTEVMCAIESELAMMTGSLTLQMKGIQGFSRLMPGDVYEICVKHGHQKWKNKIRVQKDNEQTWENNQIMFNVLFMEPMVIKAAEVKGLGKNNILGNKYCDTCDLFSAHPQIMTVNLNSSGSLKLSLIVTWNPLHGATDDMHPLLVHSNSLRSSTRSHFYGGHSPASPSLNSSDHFSHSMFSTNKSLNSLQSQDRDSGTHELSSNSSSEAYSDNRPFLPDPNVPSSNQNLSKLRPQMPERLETFKPQVQGANGESNGFGMRRIQARSMSPTSESNISVDVSSFHGSGSQLDVVKIPVPGGFTLQDIVNNVLGCLEDIQGQYPELQSFELTILELDDLLKQKFRRVRKHSITSNISLSVENALGCFDFLDSEEDEEVGGKRSPVSVSNDRMGEKRSVTPNSEQTPKNLRRQMNRQDDKDQVLNFEQVELSFISHLSYCQKLIEKLGSFGPLKCQELISLMKLKTQSLIVERLLKLVKQVQIENKHVFGFKEIMEAEVRQLWEQCSEGGRKFCISTGMLSWKLQEQIDAMLPGHQSVLSSEAVNQLVNRIIDTASFKSDDIVTVFQFRLYFSAHLPIKGHFHSLLDEVSILKDLSTNNLRELQETLNRLKLDAVPSAEIINKLALHLISGEDRKEFIAYYFEDLSQNEDFRRKLSQGLVEQLESDDGEMRQAACNSLKFFQPYDYMDQLSYVAQTDAVNAVRKTAQSTLLTLGEFGREALDFNHVGEPEKIPVTVL